MAPFERDLVIGAAHSPLVCNLSTTEEEERARNREVFDGAREMGAVLGYPCLSGVDAILQALDDGPTRATAGKMLQAIDTGRGLKSRVPLNEDETRLLLAVWTLVRIARGEDADSDRGNELGLIFTGAMQSHKLFIALLGDTVHDLRVSARWGADIEISPTQLIDFARLEVTSPADRLRTLVTLGAAFLGKLSERKQVNIPYLAFECIGAQEDWQALRHKLCHIHHHPTPAAS